MKTSTKFSIEQIVSNILAEPTKGYCNPFQSEEENNRLARMYVEQGVGPMSEEMFTMLKILNDGETTFFENAAKPGEVHVMATMDIVKSMAISGPLAGAGSYCDECPAQAICKGVTAVIFADGFDATDKATWKLPANELPEEIKEEDVSRLAAEFIASLSALLA